MVEEVLELVQMRGRAKHRPASFPAASNSASRSHAPS